MMRVEGFYCRVRALGLGLGGGAGELPAHLGF